MNIENFKEFKNDPELLVLSNEMCNLISMFSIKKKFSKIQIKGYQILKNPKLQSLKDKIENKVNLVLNKLSEINFNNLLVEFIETVGKVTEEDYISLLKSFYYKMMSDINFVKIYLEFFKVISKVYNDGYNLSPKFFYDLIENKFNFDYKNKKLTDDFSFLEDFNEENKRINHLIITKNLINIHLLKPELKNEIDTLILNQTKYYVDIYYWFQNEKISQEYKDIITKKVLNNSLPLREKVLLDDLLEIKKHFNVIIDDKKEKKEPVKIVNKKSSKTNEIDTLKLETVNIIEEYLAMENVEDIKNFIDDKCKDALAKNKFCQFTFNRYFEGTSEEAGKILELIKTLVKKQILYKSNLSRGVLLINNSWNDLSIDFNNPTKKMKDLLLCLKNMKITKYLETLLQEYKIEFVEVS
jgi:hypothetical protein